MTIKPMSKTTNQLIVHSNCSGAASKLVEASPDSLPRTTKPLQCSTSQNIYFSKLPETPLGFIKSAIRNNRMIRIRYYNNKTGGRRVGWRLIQPILLFTKKSVQYCLALYLGGSTVSSASFGNYRLFIIDRIQEAEFFDDGVSIFSNQSRQPRVDRKLIDNLLNENDF